MKEKNQLEILYKKFLDNQCTETEFDLLIRHFQTSNKEELASLIRKEFESAEGASAEIPQLQLKLLKVYGKIKSRIQAEHDYPSPTSYYKLLYRLSAAAAVLFIIAFGTWHYVHKEGSPKVEIGEKRFKDDVAPGGNRALLTLADGTQLSLTDATDGELAQEAGVVITKTEDGQLAYTVIHSDRKNNEIPQFNSIETPRGGQYQINLPDGSRVWLNAASSLRYPTTFTGKERRVELRGEAYFEVAENMHMPFRVASNNQVVEVLGTHFNINAYPDEGAIKTTLLEGSVNVQIGSHSAVLKPGQQALVEKSIQVRDVDLEEAVAWKNGRTQFSNASIQNIMRMLSRWYDVEVDYKGEMIQTGFGGSVSRSKNISEILKLLELTGDVHFQIEGRRVTVMP